MHKARRRQCKSWQNDEWRDKFLASVHWLSNGSSHLSIPVGPEQTIEVISVPCEFDAPLGFDDPPTKAAKRKSAESKPEFVDQKIEEEEDGEQQDDEDSTEERNQEVHEFFSADSSRTVKLFFAVLPFQMEDCV
jgi:hypothetical protein